MAIILTWLARVSHFGVTRRGSVLHTQGIVLELEYLYYLCTSASVLTVVIAESFAPLDARFSADYVYPTIRPGETYPAV